MYVTSYCDITNSVTRLNHRRDIAFPADLSFEFLMLRCEKDPSNTDDTQMIIHIRVNVQVSLYIVNVMYSRRFPTLRYEHHY